MISSFRDPDGYMVQREDGIYRVINESYRDDYNLLMKTGLYDKLTEDNLLIAHEEVFGAYKNDKVFRSAYKVLKPVQIPYISYPYEWCFSQLKDAAILTLKIQRIALEYGMSLKDASAYNIQFFKCKPIFIDTLSFERWKETPWIAYGQFCRHFLAPLALMSYKDVRLSQLLRIYIDGIPLDLASELLPFKTHWNFFLEMNLHWQAKAQKVQMKNNKIIKEPKFSLNSLLNVIASLESCVKGLKWRPEGEWIDYVDCNNYSPKAIPDKRRIVRSFLDKINPKIVWDLGGNTGDFSIKARDDEVQHICFDMDYSCVELCYLRHDVSILPLVMDFTNPSSSIGWDDEERMSFGERGKADVVMALALIHHLAISNHLSFPMIAKFMAKFCKHLIIEFVPKNDSQIKKLTTRSIPSYTQDNFEKEFGEYFKIEQKIKIEDSERWMYLMEKINV